ncbi:MAG: sugar phosphate isomerase/epimerase family protein [Planctomycetia bacterium]
MKLGMNLLLYTTRPDDAILPTCEHLKELGYDQLEWPMFSMTRAEAEKFRKFNEKTGLAASAVYVFGPGVNPISPNVDERAAALAAIQDRIEVCAALGVEILCGPITQTLGYFTGKPRTPQEVQLCVDFLKAAGDTAAKHNVTLTVEYLNRFEIFFLNTAADANALCKAVDHPNVKTMVDTFHANIEEKSQYDAVKAVDPKYLAHVHISENTRGIPGDGSIINWDDHFRALKEVGYDGCIMIESFSEALVDLAAAAKIWRPLFPSQEACAKQGIEFLKKRMAAF